MSTNSRRATDWLLTGSVCCGLFMPLFLGGVIAATALRGQWGRPRWRLHHSLMLCASLWGLLALASRGFQEEGQAYFAYLWLVPLLMAFYKPDRNTSEVYQRMMLALFVTDCCFNLYAVVTGADLLGRGLDAREGLLVSIRAGGLFAHSFYSGSISIGALVVSLSQRSLRPLVPLALLNMLAAGSWRFAIAVPVLLVMALIWQRMSRRGYAMLVCAASALVIVSVVLSSGLLDTAWEVNDSNTNRVFAWLLSLQKLADQWLQGAGLPITSGLTAVTPDVIDSNLIAESWYLSTALAFGVPYTVLVWTSLMVAFFGPNFRFRDRRFALLMTLVFIDMVAGEFFQGVLIYTWLWLLIGETDQRRSGGGGTQAAKVNRSGYETATGMPSAPVKPARLEPGT